VSGRFCLRFPTCLGHRPPSIDISAREQGLDPAILPGIDREPNRVSAARLLYLRWTTEDERSRSALSMVGSPKYSSRDAELSS
jgi:hypothetical protein